MKTSKVKSKFVSFHSVAILFVLSFSGIFISQGEVNAIKWDPTGSLLASCSDDCTAKVRAL